MALTHVTFTMAFWYFILFDVVVWRQVMKIDRIQSFIHKPLNGIFGFFLQWYTVFFFGVAFATVYSLWELIVNYDSMTPDAIRSNLELIYDHNTALGENLSQGFVEWYNNTCELPKCQILGKDEWVESLTIEPWLRWLSFSGQFAGGATVLLSFVHVVLVLKNCSQHAKRNAKWQTFWWKPTTRLNWLLWVYTMPAIFCVAALRAGCRMWALLTGTAHCAGADPNITCQGTWNEVEGHEFALYSSDLELAALFQYMTIYGFCQLMGEYVSHAAFMDKVLEKEEREEVVEIQAVIKRAGFMGAWAFIVVGFVRTIISFICSELSAHDMTDLPSFIEEKMEKTFSLLFSATTIFCVVNMLIICNMNAIKSKMPKANPKFLGTRILILCGEVQKRIIMAWTWGSPNFILLNSMLHEHKSYTGALNAHTWKFNKETGQLAHTALLTWETFLVVLANFFLWQPWKMDVELAELTPDFEMHNRNLFGRTIKQKPSSASEPREASIEAGSEEMSLLDDVAQITQF
jgi:hypothetical protein